MSPAGPMSPADPGGAPLEREAAPEERSFEDRLRPQTLAEMIGQERLRENLAVFIQAARRRREPLFELLALYI